MANEFTLNSDLALQILGQHIPAEIPRRRIAVTFEQQPTVFGKPMFLLGQDELVELLDVKYVPGLFSKDWQRERTPNSRILDFRLIYHPAGSPYSHNAQNGSLTLVGQVDREAYFRLLISATRQIAEHAACPNVYVHPWNDVAESAVLALQQTGTLEYTRPKLWHVRDTIRAPDAASQLALAQPASQTNIGALVANQQ